MKVIGWYNYTRKRNQRLREGLRFNKPSAGHVNSHGPWSLGYPSNTLHWKTSSLHGRHVSHGMNLLGINHDISLPLFPQPITTWILRWCLQWFIRSCKCVRCIFRYVCMYVCIWTVYVFRLWSFYAKSSESKEPMSKHQETHLAGCCPRKIESQHPILWADSPANKFLNLVYQAFGIVNSQQSQAPSIQIHHPLTD